MKYQARASEAYLRIGTGDLCQRLNVRLTPVSNNCTEVEGSIFALISFFTALATHYRLSLNEIREKFA